MASAKSLDTVLSHWSTLIENLHASPLDFYKSVEAALNRRQIPQAKNERLDYQEGGLLSAKREYLHLDRHHLTIDICGAPFGTGFFVSWWIAEPRADLNPAVKILAVFLMFVMMGVVVQVVGIIASIFVIPALLFLLLALVSVQAANGDLDDSYVRALPVIGRIYERFFRPTTYYRIDTMLMFQKAVHNAVLEVIDAMTAANGLRALGEPERRPILHEFYRRKAG